MKISNLFLVLLATLLISCTPRIGPAYIYHRDEPIEIELENLSFKPNHFVILKNQSPIMLLLRNADDVRHNFTLMAPDRAILLSKDLEPKEPATVNLGFLDPGNYTFYCLLHRHRGMEGMLMVD